MRRKVATIEREKSLGGCIERYVYTLTCGHLIAGDLRYWRHGKNTQPSTAVCNKCPASSSKN